MPTGSPCQPGSWHTGAQRNPFEVRFSFGKELCVVLKKQKHSLLDSLSDQTGVTQTPHGAPGPHITYLQHISCVKAQLILT